MSNSDKVVVLQLSSGTQVMGRVIDENDSFCLVHFPMEITVQFDAFGASRLYLSRYMPYSQNDCCVLYHSGIESLTICNDTYSSYYFQRMKAYRKSLESDLEKSLEDEPNHASFESQEEDKEFEESSSTHSGNTTKH